MLKTRVKRGAREMWHGMHSLFPPESQSLCESRADSIGFTGAKLITGSSAAPAAQDMTNRRTKFKNYVDEEGKRKNKTKSKVRAKVEHPFRILKRVFGFTKVRYRGLKKNHEWLCAAFALVNLYQHRNRLAPQGA
jgi:hypothetical protein